MSSRRRKISYRNEDDGTKDATALFDNSDFFFTLANDSDERSSSNKNVDVPKVKEQRAHETDKQRRGQAKQNHQTETKEEEHLRYHGEDDMMEPSLLTEEDYDYSIHTDLFAQEEEAARMMVFSSSPEPHKVEESATTDDSQPHKQREVVVMIDETTPRGFLSQRIIELGIAQKEKKHKQVIDGAAVATASDAYIDCLPTEIIAEDVAMQSASGEMDVDEETVSLDPNDLQPPSSRRRHSHPATATTYDEHVRSSYVNEILALTGQASSKNNILVELEQAEHDNETNDEDGDSSEGYVDEILRLTKDSDKDSLSELDDELAPEKKKEKRKRKKRTNGEEKSKYHQDTNDEEETKPGAVTVQNRRSNAQQEEPTRPGAVAVPGFPDDDSQTSDGVIIPPPSFFGNPLPSNVWTGDVEDDEEMGTPITRGVAPGSAVVVPEDYSSSSPGGAQQMQGRASGAYPEWGRRLREQMRSLSGRDSVPPSGGGIQDAAVTVVDVSDNKASPPPKEFMKKIISRRWVLLCVLLGIIVAVGFGVGLGVSNNKSNEPMQPMPTQSPTTMPTSLQDSLQRGGDIDGLVAGDGFGFSTVLSGDGNIVAVGGYNHVRVFQYDEALVDWIQVGQDIPPVEAAGDVSSGTSVSLSSDGSTVAIGTPFNNHVRVLQYTPVTGTWSQLGQTIDGQGSGDQAGFSVSLSGDGNVLAIGSPLHDGNGLDAGQVRVFQLNGETNSWSQLGQVVNTDISRSEDAFGLSVALSNAGTILAVGAPGTFLCDCRGYVRVYKYEATDSNVWVPLGEPIDGKFLGDQFGFSISLSSSGNVLAIGAPSNDGNGDASGHVRTVLYTGLTTDWIQLGQDIEGDMAEDFAGTSVSLSSDGSLVAIGSPGNDGNGQDSGHVRVFQFGTNYWIQQDEFLGETAADQSGISVSLSDNGNIVAIGADFNAGGANSDEDAGHVRVYERQGGP